MAKAFGIVNFAGNHIAVEGMQEYRPVGAFSFLGRYRVIDFTISNMSNSGIDHIQVYIRRKPQSLTAHLGTGRHYNINSKSGNLQILYSGLGMNMSLYNNDIASYIENLEYIEQQMEEYVVIAPSYMIYTQDYNKLLNTHIESGADITLLYHSVDNAKEYFLNCYAVNLNKQKGVLSLEQNHGNAKNKNIFMDTYIMKKDLFIELIHKSRTTSSVYTLLDIVNASCEDLDIRGVSHRGYFAAISDFNSYYESNPDRYQDSTESVRAGLADLYQDQRFLPNPVFRNRNSQKLCCVKWLSDRRRDRSFCYRTWMYHQERSCCQKLRRTF